MNHKNYTTTSPRSKARGLTMVMSIMLLLLASVKVNAQLAGTYVFATSTGNTLDPMAGATVIGSAPNDDTPYGASNIGFTFNFEGVAFTQFSASPDGFIRLGATTASSQFTNSFTSTTNRPKLAPFWDDLALGSLAGGGNIKVLTTGAAGSQICMIQWFVTIPRATAGAANSTFQLWLYETSNVIEFRYGTMGNTGSGSVGILGALAANFISVTTTTHVASNVTSSTSQTAAPGSGRMYSFTPPAVCSVALGGTITPATVNKCDGQTYAMSSTGATQGTGITYQWQYSSTAGGPYSPVVGGTGATTTNYTTAALTAGTYYYVLTTTCANCGPCSGNSNELTVVVNALPVVTVAPTSASICMPGGTAVSLAANGAVSYAWSPTAGLTPSTGSPVDALPTATTTYTVTGTDANGCTATATAAITVNAAPVISSVVASPNNVCQGASSTITANAGFGAGTYCSSTHANGCSGDDITHVVLSNIDNLTTGCGGTSHYTYFNAGGTQATDLDRNLNPFTIAVSFGTDGNQYFGAWIDYNQSGTFEAAEFLGASTNAGVSGTASVIFSVPGSAYNGKTRLRVVGGNDAAVTATQACGVSSSPWGETQDYDVTILNAADPFSYSWTESPANATLASTTGNPVYASNIQVSETYSVTVSALTGCTATGSALVTTGNPLACTNITATNACENQNFTLTANTTGGGAPYSYAWTDGVGGVYPDAASITANLAAGEYTFEVTVTDACGGNCTMNVHVTVNPLPGGVATGPASGVTNTTLQYIVDSYLAGSTFQWQFASAIGGPYSNIAGVTDDTANIFASSPATYYLQVVVTSPSGCTSIGGPIQTVVVLAGDNVCSAVPITVGVNGPYSNVGATLEPGESVPPATSCTGQSSWCVAANQTVWFTFVAPPSGRISIHFQPGNWDSQIALWSAGTCNDLLTGAATLLAANDDSSGSTPFNAYIAPICVVPGQTYFVQVDGYSTTTNSAFRLQLIEESIDDGDVCTIDACPAPGSTVTHTPVNIDDNNACTTDACDPITGPSHTPVNIDDGIDCTTDACDPITGISHTPTVPGPISGLAQQCVSFGSGGQVFTVAPVPGATTYNWSVPAGLTIIAGQGTTQVTVSWTSAASNAGIRGQLCVNTSNPCGNGQSCVTIDIESAKPVQPSSISGPAKVCPGDAPSYSVASVSRAAYYTWTTPTGMTITSGAGTNIIACSVDASFTGGTLSVSASNICGTSPDRSRALSLNPPIIPGAISGQVAGLCNMTVNYSIAPVASASSYLWTVTNGTINGSNTGTSINVSWGTFTTGSVSVVTVNGCGVSAARTVNTVGAPATPGVITGPVNVCAAGTYHYSISTVIGSTSYTWTAPTNTLSITGQGTKEVDIQHGLFPASNQTISVKASNACGLSAARILPGITIAICPRLGNSSTNTNLDVYPNPTRGNVNVIFEAQMEYKYTINIVDVAGRSLMTLDEVATEGKNQKVIDLSSLSSGVYFLVMNSTMGTQQVRLLVE